MRPPLRTALLLVIAAAIGAIAAAQISGVLRQRDAYPRGVMDVMAHHFARLGHNARAGTCSADATAAHLGMLVTMSGEIPQAFPGLMRDAQFAKFADDAHAFDSQVAANPPQDCAGLRQALARIGEHCDQCHRVYR